MGVSKSVGSCRGAGQRCEGLNGARRRHVRDTVKAKVTEFSCRSEVGDWGMIVVATVSHEGSCLERSWASEQGRA